MAKTKWEILVEEYVCPELSEQKLRDFIKFQLKWFRKETLANYALPGETPEEVEKWIKTL